MTEATGWGTRPQHARMIASCHASTSAPILRRSFDLLEDHGDVVSARLWATALGVCEVTVNGQPASPDLLTPGWSSYEWRLRYAAYDVSGLLQPRNVLGILLGNGWHTGRLGLVGLRALYGDVRAALLELRIRYADGTEQVIATDESWRSGPSAISSDDLYDGQSIDARLRDDDWLAAGPGPEGWADVRVVADFDADRLVPYIGPPVRRQEIIDIKRVWRSPSGATLLDFGQNLVGWLSIRVRGASGDVVTVRHAEVLDEGELGVRPLRTAKATDVYTLSGGDDLFEPTFTFHGFRYAEISGWPGSEEELLRDVVAVVIGSQLARTGTFECSNPLVNQLHANIVWGMRGNFVDVPTDCPQRDERLGWTGDLSAFAATATFLFDVEDFLRDWLHDLAVEQVHSGGYVPLVVPDTMKFEREIHADEVAALDTSEAMPPIALWSDAAVWVPWAIWEAYGDRRVLEEQYSSVTDHLGVVERTLSDADVVAGGFQFGDWLDPTAPPEQPMAGKSNPDVVATACFYRSAVLAARIARVLGRSADASAFDALSARIRRGFNQRFVGSGRIESDAPAVYTLAIEFGLLDEQEERLAGDRLAELVVEGGHRITTGFAGTPFILDALTRTGHLDDAYRLLMQTECPSWLYPVTMGATTMWERWDSMRPDGSINPGEMTSFNHYALGAVADWLHRVVGGLSPLDPGYSRFLVAPCPGADLTSASVRLDSRHGEIRVAWRQEANALTAEVVVPQGSEAVVRLGRMSDRVLPPGRHQITAHD